LEFDDIAPARKQDDRQLEIIGLWRTFDFMDAYWFTGISQD